jgi:glycosyltransferase involved in cell wall biosynthesis
VSGPLEGRLREEIEQRGLESRVALLGLRCDVPRLLAASDVYASSAAWEGLPVATLEAMAAGLPVVATAVGDDPRIIDAESGTLVAPGRPEELARALATVLSDPALRRAQGEAARCHVVLPPGARSWSRQLLSLYEEVLGRRPAAGPLETGEERPCA